MVYFVYAICGLISLFSGVGAISLLGYVLLPKLRRLWQSIREWRNEEAQAKSQDELLNILQTMAISREISFDNSGKDYETLARLCSNVSRIRQLEMINTFEQELCCVKMKRPLPTGNDSLLSRIDYKQLRA